jgi:D-alanyl-D-alanine dipeptidase
MNLKNSPAFIISFRKSVAVFCIFIYLITGLNAHTSPTIPKGKGLFHASNLVELVKFDSSIKLDIRYATSNNFTGKALYSEARAFLQCLAADALLSAYRWLKTNGYFFVYPEEWWHYNYKDYRDYAIENIPLSEINFSSFPSNQ